MSLRMLLSITPPFPSLVSACPPSSPLPSMRHVIGTMSETPWHSQMHLLSPPISRGDYSTFMVKRFFSFVRVNVMPMWSSSLWLLLSSPLFAVFYWGGRLRPAHPFTLFPHPPRLSCVQWKASVFREGRVRGHLDTPCGLASRWCGGFSEGRWSNTIRLGRGDGSWPQKKGRGGGSGAAKRSVTWPQCPAGGVISQSTSSHVLDDHLGIWQTPQQR